MKILLAVIGTHGDVLPFLAIGRGLVERGHDVSLCAPAPFARHAARARLSFHALGTQADYDRAIQAPNLWHPRRGIRPAFEVALAAAEETFRLIEDWGREGAGILVASPNAFGARLAQDRFGLPLATLHVMPFLIESRIAPPHLPGVPVPEFLPPRLRHWIGRGGDKFIVDPAVLPGLNALRARLDLRPVRRLRYWWNSPTRMLLTFPDWFAPPQADWPRQAMQVGFPIADRFGDREDLGPELSTFLDAGAPPLVFTYGSGMCQAGRFFATAARLCRRMGRRGVFLSPQDGQVPGDMPPDILHVPYAPLSLLLPRCAALVHHGGIGTVAQALAAGVPQLIVPVAFNHFDEGKRLQRLGVGTLLRRRAFTARRAAGILSRLLIDRGVVEACAAAKAWMAADDGVGNACDGIERMSMPPASHAAEPAQATAASDLTPQATATPAAMAGGST